MSCQGFGCPVSYVSQLMWDNMKHPENIILFQTHNTRIHYGILVTNNFFLQPMWDKMKIEGQKSLHKQKKMDYYSTKPMYMCMERN